MIHVLTGCLDVFLFSLITHPGSKEYYLFGQFKQDDVSINLICILIVRISVDLIKYILNHCHNKLLRSKYGYEYGNNIA